MTMAGEYEVGYRNVIALTEERENRSDIGLTESPHSRNLAQLLDCFFSM